MKYTDKDLREAIMVSDLAHLGQTYDGVFPYKKHITDVMDVLKQFGFGNKHLISGALHDALEDTALSYNKIKRHFGLEVAEMVYCVTDELGRNRAEKKRKTLPKTASNPDAIIVKLADRIANLRQGGKVDMYAKEYSEFRDALYDNSPDSAKDMWLELEKILKIET
jgi:(p)ppGpp synthase/HD superfamily hydrolase